MKSVHNRIFLYRRIKIGSVFIVFTAFLFMHTWNYLHAHSDGAPLACVGAGRASFYNRVYPPGNLTCNALGCHDQYMIDSGKGKFMLFVLDQCKQGEVVDILVSFKKTDTDYHGFQITAQDRYFNRLVGTFMSVEDDEDIQVDGGGHFATHTKKGANRKYWHVKWQAPPEGFPVANPVRFYAVGLESDNDGTARGDYVYRTTRGIVVKSKKTQKISHRKKH